MTIPFGPVFPSNSLGTLLALNTASIMFRTLNKSGTNTETRWAEWRECFAVLATACNILILFQLAIKLYKSIQGDPDWRRFLVNRLDTFGRRLQAELVIESPGILQKHPGLLVRIRSVIESRMAEVPGVVELPLPPAAAGVPIVNIGRILAAGCLTVFYKKRIKPLEKDIVYLGFLLTIFYAVIQMILLTRSMASHSRAYEFGW